MTDRKTQLDTLAVCCLVGCALLWGVNQTATKIALQEVPPLLQAAGRSLGAAVLLGLWATLRGLPLKLARGTWAPGLLAGLLFAAEFGCIFIGLQYTSASRIVVFIYLAPFVVALGMPLVAPGERLGAVQFAGLMVAFAGVVWAFAEGWGTAAAGPRQWLGDALGVLAATLWAGTTLTIRGSSLSQSPPEQTLMCQLLVSSLALGAAAWVSGEAWPAGPLRAVTWAALGFQTVIITFASYLLWFWLVRHYPATRISAFTLLTPVFGLLAGVWLLDEPLTARLLVALAAVVLGTALVSRPSPPRVVAQAPGPAPRAD
ncbi:DMT family transporter [Ideonella azotifigens]|uniref:DMT family transporter n=1 Tax=Ideonella azotifigens TaxID=513160 RepID=A0ABN1JLE5_9BURK|nr:DMT family transporter [Ideonella azotifigens]MCD2339727.1 DMT family transporter [Ideonella azotifigens]